MVDYITNYFPQITPLQHEQFRQLGNLYQEWNKRINIISRKDIDHLFLHHILHSLSIAKIVSFLPGTLVMDAGTGGGLPGIPLAIFFPDVEFTLVDSTSKKIKVVEVICRELGLLNVNAVWARVEEIKNRFDFITGRAVTDLQSFYLLVKGKIKKEGFNPIPNGILYIKGGDLDREIGNVPAKVTIFDLSSFFREPYFTTKKVVHIYNF